jgi:class 3 adenylate cyclase
VDEQPVTRYAKAPDGVSIAYQVTGDGPFNVVFPPGLPLPIDVLWEDPSFVRFARSLGGFSRTVWRELRGVGASGGDVEDLRDDDILCGDLTAVLDAVGCERVVLVGFGFGGPTAIRYAVLRPERVSALVLINTFARYVQDDHYPWGLSPGSLQQFDAMSRELWGTGASLEVLAPSQSRDDTFRAWLARGERLGVAPDLVGSNWFLDVRGLLSAVMVPTLVLHRRENRFVHVGAGRYLGEHIADAKYVELSGDDHLFFVGDTDALLDEVEEFVTGGRQAPEGNVVTATVLVTDIVASTEQSAGLGHRKWTALTDAHDTMVRATLLRYRGREVKTMGDGFLATFDATSRAVRAAIDIVTGAGDLGVAVRAGVHTGEVEVRPDDVIGLTVSIAKRICDLAGPNDVFVSEAVKALIVGSGLVASEKGTFVLKGVPDEWRLFAVGS